MSRPSGFEAVATEVFIFDMDGTMIDSMAQHARSWGEFSQRHGLKMPIEEAMRRTTRRPGAECLNEIFQREIGAMEATRLVAEKENVDLEAASRAGMGAVAICTTHSADQLSGSHVMAGVRD